MNRDDAKPELIAKLAEALVSCKVYEVEAPMGVMEATHRGRIIGLLEALEVLGVGKEEAQRRACEVIERTVGGTE